MIVGQSIHGYQAPINSGGGMVGSSGETVAARLEAGRKELLDLGLRNPLLNYRPLRSRGVEVADELPAEVFRLLVRERRALSFAPAAKAASPTALTAGLPAIPGLSADVPSSMPSVPASPAFVDDEWPFKTEIAPVPVPATRPVEDGPFIPEDTSAPTTRHSDRRLQTLLPAEQLQTRLLATYYAARTFVEEQGANILYLALGLLRWYEADNSDEPRRAPLLLIPVELARSTARERFQLRYSEEEVGHNLSLAAKLHADFGITLPALPSLDDLDIDAYLAAVAEAVAEQPRWVVEDTVITLGLFSFGKFLMYRDLDSATWPVGEGPASHPVLGALLGDGLHEAEPHLTEDDHLDRHAASADLQLVVEADSSQILAILAANEGRNLVIQGPPGTGKSQTITNLIAEAIGRGKRVLFVAEKKAALDVVKRRLDSVGLGDACLELHGHKTNKKALLGQLQQTLQLGRPRQEDQAGDLAALGQLRDRLNDYADAVNTPVERSGVNPYAAFGELLRLRQQRPDATYPRLAPEGMADWSAADFARRLALVAELQGRLARLGPPAAHPFWGSRRLVFLPLERDQLRDTLRVAREAANRAASVAADLAGLLSWSPPARPGEGEPPPCRWASWASASPDLRGFRPRQRRPGGPAVPTSPRCSRRGAACATSTSATTPRCCPPRGPRTSPRRAAISPSTVRSGGASSPGPIAAPGVASASCAARCRPIATANWRWWTRSSKRSACAASCGRTTASGRAFSARAGLARPPTGRRWARRSIGSTTSTPRRVRIGCRRGWSIC